MITHKFDYKSYKREVVNGSRHYIIDDVPLPSVTTILSDTANKDFLIEWRKRVGPDQATQITTVSATTGTHLHKNLENYVNGIDELVGSPMSKIMFNLIKEHGMKYVDEVWGTEVPLYALGLYAGTTDLVGTWKGQPAIIDFKNSRRLKKKEWIEDYFLQLCAYAIAHNEMFNTEIKTGVILMATQNGEYQEFVIEGSEFDEYQYKWLDRLNQYFEKHYSAK